MVPRSGMSSARGPWFFVPHVALVLIVVIGDFYWLHWFWPFLVVSFALPWWCRFAGAGWPRRRSFALGPGVLVIAYLVAFVVAWMTATELPFFALLVLAITLLLFAYSLAVYRWRLKEWAFAATVAGPALVVYGYPVLGVALLVSGYWYFIRNRRSRRR